MRLGLTLCFIALVLAACGSMGEEPTPLPTAVPPDTLPDEAIWAVSFRYEFPEGTFGLGPHRYAFLIHCPVLSAEDTHHGWHYFTVSEEVAALPEPLYLRLFGLSRALFNSIAVAEDVVAADQQIVAVVHLVGLSKPAAEMAASECELFVFWDNTGRQLLAPGEPFQQ